MAPCEWCGEEGTKENPVVETVVSPPVSGWPVEEVFMHRSCAAQAARQLTR